LSISAFEAFVVRESVGGLTREGADSGAACGAEGTDGASVVLLVGGAL